MLASFHHSRPLSIGVELELQLVNKRDYDLTPSAPDLMRLLEKQAFPGAITQEITSSMIEISTDICQSHQEVLEQLITIRNAIVKAADKLDIGMCGGGTHPFQHWSQQRISDTPRYHQISELYGYLSKQFTVFGQHVHIGCPGPDEALILLHGLSRYIPHFIALTASSPFVQGVDTGFHSARLNSVFAFPLSGRAPFLTQWQDFIAYFNKMAHTGLVKSMKDFYWDIRPKPEFGTIEIRVMDTPLTIERAAMITAYIQCVSRWLMVEKTIRPEEDHYLSYTFNRFQACRFGLDGTVADPVTGDHRSIREDILALLDNLAPHAVELDAEDACSQVAELARGQDNDATWIRRRQEREQLLPEVVRQQCLLWQGAPLPA